LNDLHAYSTRFGNGANPGDVWQMNPERNMGRHLAPFPRELVQRAITLACPDAVCLGGYFREFTFGKRRTTGFTDCGHGDMRPGVVLDPFMGTGTSVRVACEMGRTGIGVDLYPHWP